MTFNQYRKLYIIGNGFDLYHGLHTSYCDFKVWLRNKRPNTYNQLCKAYYTDGDWWRDFEINLGALNVERLIRSFHTSSHNGKTRAIWTSLSGSEKIDFNSSSRNMSGEQLEKLYDEIGESLKQWISEEEHSYDVQPILYLDADAFYISFNYTSLLETTYKISADNILYIHGNNERNDNLVWGHDKSSAFLELQYDGLMPDDDNMQLIRGAYNSVEKNPYEIAIKYSKYFKLIEEIEAVIVLGLSLSPVDEDYFYGQYSIANYIPRKAEWFVSWYSDMDKIAIKNFFSKMIILNRCVPKYSLIRFENLRLRR